MVCAGVVCVEILCLFLKSWFDQLFLSGGGSRAGQELSLRRLVSLLAKDLGVSERSGRLVMAFVRFFVFLGKQLVISI